MLDTPNRRLTGGCGAKTGASASLPIGPLSVLNSATEYANRCNQSALEAGGEIAQSWLRFLGDRWAKDLAFPQLIANCKTAEDLSVAYAEFLQQAARDYSAELNEVANAAWTATRTALILSDVAIADGCCGNCENKQSS